MGFGWQEIDKTLDLGYIRVAGLHRECKPTVLFDPPNFCPRTMTHVCLYVRTVVKMLHMRNWFRKIYRDTIHCGTLPNPAVCSNVRYIQWS